MAVSPVSNVASSASTQLKLEDLLRVMLTELSYQDPLKPVDNKDFMAQVAQFSSLDASRQLNDRLDTLLSLQSINQTVGLLGKTIDASTASGQISGTVTALAIVGGEPKMTVTTTGGQVVAGIAFSQLQNIR